ncbi:MAG: JAB domain-containing protein [Verrucomicrobiota bacterium]
MSESPQSRPTYLREVQISYKKKRVKNGSPVGEPVSQSKQVYELFKDLENEGKEKMIAIGSVNAIFGRPFEAIRSAIALNAVGIILVHNHPSGNPTPSQLDKNFTTDLKEITDKGGMGFYDHIIIGEDSYFSFADAGLLE